MSDEASLEPTAQALFETSAQQAAQAALEPLADALEARAPVDAQFANVAVDPDSQRVILYRVGGAASSEALSSMRALAGASQVDVRPALWSSTEAEAFVAQLDGDVDALEAQGVTLTSWGPDGEGGAFHLGVEGDLQGAEKLLRARYPRQASRFSVELSTPTANSRTHDRVPYIGGAGIVTPSKDGSSEIDCTDGFAAYNSAGRYVVTAAHCRCDAGNASVFDALGAYQIGSFSSSIDRGYDAAFIHVSSDTGSIYTGVYGKSGSISAVSSMHAPRVGEYICTSGYWSDLRCAGKVKGWTHVHLSTCAGKVTVAEWYADQTHHLSLTGHGDSGGPVFVRYASGLVGARGIISSADGSHNAACAEGGNDRGCSYRVYFPPITSIAARHGLHLTGF